MVLLAVPVPAGDRAAAPARSASLTASKKIVVNNIPYTFVTLLHTNKDGGEVWSTADRKIAKQFVTWQPANQKKGDEQMEAFTREMGFTEKVLGPVSPSSWNGGESMVNGVGVKSAWIITLRVPGEQLMKTSGFKNQKAKGMQQCTNYLRDVVRPEFKRKFLELYNKSKLVHLDAHMGNTHWNDEGTKIIGFFDFGRMDVPGGKIFHRVLEMNVPNLKNMKPVNTAEDWADLWQLGYYQDIYCDPKFVPPTPQ